MMTLGAPPSATMATVFDWVQFSTAPVVAASLSSGQATLRVALAAGGLAVLGVALLVLTVRWWKGTRPEPEALGSLQLMSDRRFLAASPDERAALLAAARRREAAADA